MNRRGDLAITLILIVALFLSMYALFVFVTFDDKLNAKFIESSDMMINLDFSNRYIIEEAKLIVLESVVSGTSSKEKFMEIANDKDLRLNLAGNFFGKVRNGEFSFDNQEEGYLLKVDGVFVSLEKEDNIVKRNINLCMMFNENGEYVKTC